MSELQAALEIQVELSKFYNVDLFQRGYYQVRTALRTAPRAPVKVEVSLPRNSECSLVFPASIMNGVAISKTFQILYRNEDVTVNDVIVFKVYMLVDSQRIEASIEEADFNIELELWFSDEEFGPEGQNKLQCISQRTLRLHMSASKGLHHHIPVLFDYFHLSVMCVTVHATLLALIQPYINLNRQQPKNAWASKTESTSTMESVLFGTPGSVHGAPAHSNPRVQQAVNMHRKLCHILLCSYESLQTSFEALLRKLPPYHKPLLDHVDCHKKLDDLCRRVQKLTAHEDELFPTIQSDFAQLCAQNVMLWTQYVQVVTLCQRVTYILAQEHHSQRVKRFAEGFFTYENPVQEALACFEHSVHGHADLTTVVRNSNYFQLLPPLTLECLQMDGDVSVLPIVYEDIYGETGSKKIFITGKSDESKVDGSCPTPPSELKSFKKRDRPERQGSHLSDGSSHSDSSSSPHFKRTSGKLSFIQNMKPENVKRPSAVLNPEVAAQVATDPTACTLVGYRKTVCTSTFEPVLELGTLSIANFGAAGDDSMFSSLPSLLAEKGKTDDAESVDGKGADRSSSSSSSSDMGDAIQNGYLPSSGYSANSSDLEMAAANEKLDVEKLAEGLSQVLGEPEVKEGEDEKEEEKEMEEEKKDEEKEKEEEKEELSEDKEENESKMGSENKEEEEQAAKEEGELKQEEESEKKEETAGEKTEETAEKKEGVESEQKESQEEKPEEKSNESDEKPVDQEQSTETLPVVSETDVAFDLAEESPPTENEEAKTEPPPVATVPSLIGMGVLSGGDSFLPVVQKPQSTQAETKENKAEKEEKEAKKEETKFDDIDDNYLSGQCTILELLQEEFDKKNAAAAAAKSTDSGIGSSNRNSLMETATGSESPSDLSSTSSQETRGASSASSSQLSSVTEKATIRSSNSTPELSAVAKSKVSTLVSPVADKTVSFIAAKETLRKQLSYQGHLYSDFVNQASTRPYFWPPESLPGANSTQDEGVHLIVCVHGLDGNSADLRLVKTYMELALPGEKIDFLMSERNQADTFADFNVMTDRLVGEINYHIEMYGFTPNKLSFVGHSLGNLIIRSALSRPDMTHLLPKLHTFLSLSGPHLGTLYNNSGLVNMGMWFMQKWKKSGSLLQLSMKDHSDPRQTFLYKLSQKTGLEFFRHILLVGSQQDRYVPYHSSRIELCKAALRDTSGSGAVYAEMVSNILQPIVFKSDITFIRYDVFHALPSNANTMIGRAAHIAVLDSELFIEKFITVAALKYFK